MLERESKPGPLLPLKEASLYVDPDDDGNLASETPEAVGKDIAAKCIDYARAEVQRLWVAEIVRASVPPSLVVKPR